MAVRRRGHHGPPGVAILNYFTKRRRTRGAALGIVVFALMMFCYMLTLVARPLYSRAHATPAPRVDDTAGDLTTPQQRAG